MKSVYLRYDFVHDNRMLILSSGADVEALPTLSKEAIPLLDKYLQHKDERSLLEAKMKGEGRLPPSQSLTLKWPVLHEGDVPSWPCPGRRSARTSTASPAGYHMCGDPFREERFS